MLVMGPRTAVIVMLLLTAGLAAAQDTDPPPLFKLLPADRTYPIARVCSTSEGLCALPLTHPPGEPCSCVRADGSSVAGICTH